MNRTGKALRKGMAVALAVLVVRSLVSGVGSVPPWTWMGMLSTYAIVEALLSISEELNAD